MSVERFNLFKMQKCGVVESIFPHVFMNHDTMKCSTVMAPISIRSTLLRKITKPHPRKSNSTSRYMKKIFGNKKKKSRKLSYNGNSNYVHIQLQHTGNITFIQLYSVVLFCATLPMYLFLAFSGGYMMVVALLLFYWSLLSVVTRETVLKGHICIRIIGVYGLDIQHRYYNEYSGCTASFRRK